LLSEADSNAPTRAEASNSDAWTLTSARSLALTTLLQPAASPEHGDIAAVAGPAAVALA
jgi:hypothetical protein